MKVIILFLFLVIPLIYSQQRENVDFLELNAEIEIDTLDFKVNGSVQKHRLRLSRWGEYEDKTY